jgi:hypothetical protein
MDQTLYHVLLEGRSVGPYDRRTIVGMRIKKTLTSADVLIGEGGGARLTVGDLIGRPRRDDRFNPSRSGSFSVVHAVFTAALVGVQGRGVAIPAFKGEIQARVQGDVVRLAGRFRRGFGWKEDRVKILRNDVMHTRIEGSAIQLWLRPAAGGRREPQRITLEMFSPTSAAELAGWFALATPLTASAPADAGNAMPHGLLVAIAGVAIVVGMVVTVLLLMHRVR